MSKHTKFSPEVRDRAIRMVYEVRESHTSQWAAIEAVASKIGCTAQTLSSWIRKAAAPALYHAGQNLPPHVCPVL